MKMTEQYRKALFIAIKAHDGQHDRGGEPYILHPLTVSERVESETEKIVAILHDVVEDTYVTTDDVRTLLGDEIADCVFLMTHTDDLSYEQYVKRLSKNEVCRHVKLADLSHNMQPERLHNPGPKDYERLKKYERAKNFLMAVEKGEEAEEGYGE